MVAIFLQKPVVYNSTKSFPSVVQGSLWLLRYETCCSFLSQMSLWTKKVSVLYIFSLLSPSDLNMTSMLWTKFEVTYLKISFFTYDNLVVLFAGVKIKGTCETLILQIHVWLKD